MESIILQNVKYCYGTRITCDFFVPRHTPNRTPKTKKSDLSKLLDHFHIIHTGLPETPL